MITFCKVHIMVKTHIYNFTFIHPQQLKDYNMNVTAKLTKFDQQCEKF